MLGRLRWVKRAALDLPRNLKLTYCLLFDDRVPAANKALFALAFGVILNPVVDIPLWIPVVGEADAVALSLLATRVFVGAAPAAVVEEHRRLLRERRSRFDNDLAAGRRLALVIARRQPDAAAARGGVDTQPQSLDQ